VHALSLSLQTLYLPAHICRLSEQVEQPRPLDLTPESASMLEKLMLAQAQECVLEKAIADKKAPGVVARLAKQCAVFYRECSTLLAASPLNQVCRG
jgi:programmed cell death 6-interacting protein